MALATIAAGLASPLLKSGFELLLPVVHDVLGGGAKADAIVSQIKLKSLEIDGQKIAAQQKTLEKELEGNWLQRSWRPIAMFVFMFLLVWQVVFVSLINAMFDDPMSYDAQLIYAIIDVIKWGMGGYIVGRTGEKITEQIINKGIKKREIVVQEVEGDQVGKTPTDATIVESPFMKPVR